MLAYILNPKYNIQLEGVFKRVHVQQNQVSCSTNKLYGGGKRIHVLIGMSSWTKKREVMHVSRLKGWYSVNKISSRSNRQSIHITEEDTQF